MDSIKPVVAANLKRVCRLKKVKNKDIAFYMGVSESAVSHWLKCDNSLDMDNLYQICRYIGVSLDQIFGIDPIIVDTLTSEENELIKAYRNSGIDSQNGVRRFLGLPELKKDTLSKAE